MGMWTRVTAGRGRAAMMLNEGARRPERSFWCDRERCDAASPIVGHEQVPSRRIERQMARGRPAGWALVQGLQCAAGGLDGKGRNRAVRRRARKACFVDG